MSGRWKYVLGPPTGGRQWELADAKQRRLTARLKSPSQASFQLDGRHELAGRIDELATDLHVMRRRRRDGLSETLYRGRIGGVSDELSETGHTMTVPSLDYRGVLERRMLPSGSEQVFDGYDQLYIANGLLQQTQNATGGDLGIAYINEPSGVVRDREYDLGDSVGQRIQELSEVIDGFDWDVCPVGPSGLELCGWYPQRGRNVGVTLEYGGLARTVRRQVDSGEYANAVRVTGRPPEGEDVEPAIQERTADGITEAAQGRWDKVIGTSITTTGALEDRADWLVDHHQVIQPAYTVRLRRGFWDGPTHIWLGDTVRLVVMSGRLAVDVQLRVFEVDIEITDSGDEDVTLTLGAPRPDYARRASAMEKRIADLEAR